MTLSFVHKAEVAMRHELGVETLVFGRDFPHAEGTWPNTRDWLSDAFAGVPDDELRLVLGENAVRVLGLDRAKLAAVAARIGPTIDDVTGRTPDLDPRLVANWDARGGYLKPPELHDPERHRRVAPGRPGARRVAELNGMARFAKPAEGSWTQHYPELGTGLVSYEDSISPEFYELEREAIFKRVWLNVGRVEQLPRSGSYFTKELAVAKTSVVVVRDKDGEVRAFHNICRHRGNKLVWTGLPAAGDERQLPPVRLQVPRVALRARRRLHVRAAGKRVLRPRQGRLRAGAGALRRVGRVHLRQPRPGSSVWVTARVPRPDGGRAGGLPVRPDDRASRAPLGSADELEDLAGRAPGAVPRAHRARERAVGRLRRPDDGHRLRGAALPDSTARTG